MKIDYFHISPIPSNHANAVQVMKTCAALTRRGADVSLFCVDAGATEAEARAYYDVDTPFPIRFWRIGTRRLVASSLFRLKCVLRMLSAQRVVYTREIGVAWLAGLLGRPFAYELHAVPHKRAQRWMARKAVRARSLVSLVSISRGVEADFLAEFGPVAENKRALAACAADPLPKAVHGKEQATEGRISVGYVGHLYPGKGAGLIHRLAIRLPQLDFHVVGKVEDPALTSTDVPNLIAYGPLPHSEAMNRLEAFDIVVAPYQHDASAGGVLLSRWFSPLKIFEYMAHAKPVVSSDLPVIREVLTDGETALLVPPDDGAAWSVALERLASDPALRGRLAEAGRALLEAEYSYDRRADRILSALTR